MPMAAKLDPAFVDDRTVSSAAFTPMTLGPLILLGGVNTMDTVESALGEGFEFVAMARALLRDPGLVKKFHAGTAREGLCVHCMKCMATIYEGTHCVLRPGPPAVSTKEA